MTAGGALGLGAVLAACGSDSSGDSGDAGGDGAWSFKDDRGRTARTPHTPKKIAAFIGSAAALHDYGVECSAVFGPSKPVRGKPNPQAGDLDLDKVESLGTGFGEFDIEKYAKLRPDLLISNMFPPPKLWFVPDESSKKIYKLAPSIGIKGSNTTLLDPLRRYEELAKALGGDTGSQRAQEAKKRFKAAEKRLREAAKAARKKGGVKVLAMTGDAENMYVAVPDSYCDLHYFKDLGVEIVEGKKSDKWGFWEFLSWEKADSHHADIIMIDNREQALPPSELRKKPTWERLPAVKAGQTIPWAMEERYSYAGYAPRLEALAEAIEKARKLT
ncbi:ABC transporter substrate-binding protein [Streptomyces boncukensis]|uniref:ABC transporter substrate-binding protein n=1 Tax=Streptomyces boncukensis TaxID=2711219 RepID=UPI001F49A13C|nr:ABC transporter substrate-binding protein [Streptomyces boncukensis]